jgi:hypothetical protein
MRAEQEFQHRRLWEFGGAAEATIAAVELGGESRHRTFDRLDRNILALTRSTWAVGKRGADLLALAHDLVALGTPRVSYRVEYPPEGRHAHAIVRRPVGSPVEGQTVRRHEDV